MDLLDSAVLNNVEWCALVARRGGAADVSRDVWLVAGRPPALFPDAVTLRAAVSADELVDLLSSRGSCSVKDSYADVDLEPHGFRELFSARWIALTVPRALPRPTGWSPLTEPTELVAWCAAADLPDPLPAGILEYPSVRVLAVRRKGRLTAGAVVISSGAVVGISNMFQIDEDARLVWGEVAAVVGQLFPSLPVVGYEHGADLDAALAAGFTNLGPLRVWLRSAAP